MQCSTSWDWKSLKILFNCTSQYFSFVNLMNYKVRWKIFHVINLKLFFPVMLSSSVVSITSAILLQHRLYAMCILKYHWSHWRFEFPIQFINRHWLYLNEYFAFIAVCNWNLVSHCNKSCQLLRTTCITAFVVVELRADHRTNGMSASFCRSMSCEAAAASLPFHFGLLSWLCQMSMQHSRRL